MTLMLIEFLQQLGKSVREMLVSDEVIISQRRADASAARRQIQDGIPVAFHLDQRDVVVYGSCPKALALEGQR